MIGPTAAFVSIVPFGLLLVGVGRTAERMVACRHPDGTAPPWIVIAVPLLGLWASVSVASAGVAARLPPALVPGAIGLVLVLTVAAAVDLVTQRIPAALTAIGGAAILTACVVAGIASDEVELGHVLLGAVAVPTVLELLARSTRVALGVRGVGVGDVRLAVSIGPVVAAIAPGALVVLALATLVVALPPALHARWRVGPGATVALAPALALGSLVALVGGRPLAAALAVLLGPGAG